MSNLHTERYYSLFDMLQSVYPDTPDTDLVDFLETLSQAELFLSNDQLLDLYNERM